MPPTGDGREGPGGARVIEIQNPTKSSERVHNFHFNGFIDQETGQRFFIFNSDASRQESMVAVSVLTIRQNLNRIHEAVNQRRQTIDLPGSNFKGEPVIARIPVSTLYFMEPRFLSMAIEKPSWRQRWQKLRESWQGKAKPPESARPSQSDTVFVTDLNSPEFSTQIGSQLNFDNRMTDRASVVARIGSKYERNGGNVMEDAGGSTVLPDGTDLLVWVDGMGGMGPGKSNRTDSNFTSLFARELVNVSLGLAKRDGVRDLLSLATQVGDYAPTLNQLIGQNHGFSTSDPESLPQACMGLARVTRNEEGALLEALNIGDTRVYMFNPAGGRLEQLTVDHSLVSGLVRNRTITPEEADAHPQKSVVAKGVGHKDWNSDNDDYPLSPISKQIPKGTFLLFVTDGQTYDQYTSQYMRDALTRGSIPQTRQEIMARLNAAASHDNTISIVYEVK